MNDSITIRVAAHREDHPAISYVYYDIAHASKLPTNGQHAPLYLWSYAGQTILLSVKAWRGYPELGTL